MSTLSPGAATLATDVVTQRLSGGSIVIYDAMTLLVTIRLPSPAFMPALSGEAHARPIPVGRVVAAGKPRRFAVLDKGGVPFVVGTIGDGPEDDLTLSEPTLVPGEDVFISSCRYIQEVA